MRTGEYIAAAMAVHGTGAIYGHALPGAGVVPVDDPRLAHLFALADARVHARPAACHHDGAVTIVPPGTPAGTGGRAAGATVTDFITDASSLPAVLARALVAGGRLHVDPDGRVPRDAPVELLSAAPEFEVPEGLPARLAAAGRPIVLAGQGVVTHGATGALRTLAALTRTGVLNTWAAKGVLPWHSRYHLGTAGLQARDLRLAGLASYDLVVTTGIGPGELPGAPEPGPGVVDVHPAALSALAEATGARTGGEETTGSPLRDVLSAVVQAAWGAESVPPPPTALTRRYALMFGGCGLLAADAGTAGFVLGRTFPTSRPGTVVLPPYPAPGFAAAAVFVRRLRDPRLPALAFVDGDGPDAVTAEILALAEAMDIAVPLVCWSPSGSGAGAGAGTGTDAGTHAADVARAALSAGPVTVTAVYDPAQLAELEAAAGPVRAWSA